MSICVTVFYVLLCGFDWKLTVVFDLIFIAAFIASENNDDNDERSSTWFDRGKDTHQSFDNISNSSAVYLQIMECIIQRIYPW